MTSNTSELARPTKRSAVAIADVELPKPTVFMLARFSMRILPIGDFGEQNMICHLHTRHHAGQAKLRTTGRAEDRSPRAQLLLDWRARDRIRVDPRLGLHRGPRGLRVDYAGPSQAHRAQPDGRGPRLVLHHRRGLAPWSSPT